MEEDKLPYTRMSYGEAVEALVGARGWIAPPATVYDVGVELVTPGRHTVQMSRTGRLFVVPLREEEKMTDRAVELLAQQRQEEAEEKAHAEAEAIVEKVKALQVGTYVNGDKVMFTKQFGEKVYTYLALRVVEGDTKQWFVTNQRGAMTDLALESLLARDGGFVAFGELRYDGPIKASNYMGWGADALGHETDLTKRGPVQTKYEDPTSTHAVGLAEPDEGVT